MTDYKEIDDALALIEKMCTAEQIHGLLATRKGEEGVRLTAEKKNLLVVRNLRDALDARAITLESVFNLIRDAEENGNQHYLLFSPENQEAHRSPHLGFPRDEPLGPATIKSHRRISRNSADPQRVHVCRPPTAQSAQTQRLADENLRRHAHNEANR